MTLTGTKKGTPRPPAREEFRRPLLLTLSILLSLAALSPNPAPGLENGAPDSPTRVGISADPLDPLTYFTEEEISAWHAYRQHKTWAHIIGVGSVLVFYATFVLTGLNRALRRIAERAAAWCTANPFLVRAGIRWPRLARTAKAPEHLFGGTQWLEVLLYCLFFLFLIRLLFFPQEFYRTYWFDLRYGLSNYSLGLWLVDYLKGLCIGTVLFAFMVFGIYGLIRRVGKWWWVLLWAGVSVSLFGYVVVFPYGSHIYNRFRPLESGELRDRLEGLAARSGLRLEDILVVDASRRTKKVNAYLTGSGPSERVVLYDTLLDAFTPREIAVILAHELAHWKEPDEKLSHAVFSLTVFLVLGLSHLMLKFGARIRRFHYASAADVAGLPILFLTFFVSFQLLRPANLAWKRARELRADRVSLELACDPEAFLSAHAKLARWNHTDVAPHPLTVVFFFSHPTFLERVEVALTAECESGIGNQG
jgi:STE24 endopeptidase